MIRKLIRQTLVAQTLSALTVSLCLLIDNIMITRFLGVTATAAYELSNPILLAVGAVASLLAAGVQVACSKSLGSGSREETNKGYSSAIALMAGISAVATAGVFLLRGPLATAMGAGTEGELYNETRGYLAGFVLGAPASMAALVLVPFLQMAGKSGLLVAAVLGMTVADVAFDLLSIHVFHAGMFGMGLASALSYYVAVLTALGYFLSKKCVFTFSPKLVSFAKIKELAAGGVPTIFSMASSVVLVFVMNRILMGVGGSDAVAAYAVMTSIGNAGNCISTGIGGVSLTLGGILFNEEDRTGLKELMADLSKYAVILGAGVGVLLAAFAPVLVRIFLPGENEAIVRNMAIQGVRMFGLGLISCTLVNVLKSLYQGTGRVRITEVMSVLECAVMPAAAAFVFTRFMGVTGAWLAFATGETLVLLCAALYVWKKNGSPGLKPEPFLLLGEDFGAQPENMLEMDIRSLEDVTAAARKAEDFCRKHGQSEKMCTHIALCVEEMAGNTVIHGFEPNGKNHLSVRVQHRGNRWILRFRDDCRAFDPVSYVPSGEDGEAVGIRLVMAMADDVRYTYSLNLNNLTIRMTAA